MVTVAHLSLPSLAPSRGGKDHQATLAAQVYLLQAIPTFTLAAAPWLPPAFHPPHSANRHDADSPGVGARGLHRGKIISQKRDSYGLRPHDRMAGVNKEMEAKVHM
jgi:hypothetical protein